MADRDERELEMIGHVRRGGERYWIREDCLEALINGLEYNCKYGG